MMQHVQKNNMLGPFHWTPNICNSSTFPLDGSMNLLSAVALPFQVNIFKFFQLFKR